MLNRRFFLDSSALLLYFNGASNDAKAVIEGEGNLLYCSTLSFFEVKKSMEKKKAGKEQTDFALDIMRRKCIAVPPTEDLCEKAAGDSLEHGLYAIDSIIYRSASNADATLVTADSDFKKKKLKNVMLV